MTITARFAPFHRSAFAAAAGALLLGFAMPAHAADRAADAKAAPSATNDSQVRPAAAERKYCFVGDLTGSRLARKVCKTRAEWSAEGIDVGR